jgi:hypothetical protein
MTKRFCTDTSLLLRMAVHTYEVGRLRSRPSVAALQVARGAHAPHAAGPFVGAGFCVHSADVFLYTPFRVRGYCNTYCQRYTALHGVSTQTQTLRFIQMPVHLVCSARSGILLRVHCNCKSRPK